MTKRMIAVLGSAALALTGCAKFNYFDRDRAEFDNDKTVVAMSLDAGALAGKESGGYRFSAASLNWDRPLSLSLGTTGIAPAHGMFETSEASIELGTLRLVFQTSRHRFDMYETAVQGPEIGVEAGQFVYVGSVTIADAEFDQETGEPRSVRVCVEDAWQDDVKVWQVGFALARAQQPMAALAPCWGDEGRVTLNYVKPFYTGGPLVDPTRYRTAPKQQPPHIPTGGGGERNP